MALLQKGVAIAAGRMPKIIKPQAHAILDYAVAGTFFLAGALYWRRNRRAAVSSLFCAGVTVLNSALTDYPGGVWKVMSFQTHGKVDAGLAGMTAMMPHLMEFKDASESKFFAMQSVTETAVTALTDFEYYEHPSSSRLRRRQEEDAA